MNGVKALIYKDLRLKRKTVILSMSSWLLFFIVGVSICLSRDFGNLRYNDSFSDDNIVMFSFSLSIIAMISLVSADDTIYRDTKCHWDRLEYTLPLTPQKTAAVKVLMMGTSAVVSLIISASAQAVLYTLYHREIVLDDFKNTVMIMFAAMMISVISNTLVLRLKDPQAVTVLTLTAFVAVSVPLSVILFKKMEHIMETSGDLSEDEVFDLTMADIAGKYTQIRDILFPFSLLVFAGIAAIAYFLYLRQLKRREN